MSINYPDFIVVDDSRLDCFISQKIISTTCQNATVQSFINAADALDEILNRQNGSAKDLTIIILDIQMPVMNGFDFADAFENLSEIIKSGYVIFMVTSSTNESDLIRARNYPSIKFLYNKPLTKSIILEIINTSYTN